MKRILLLSITVAFFICACIIFTRQFNCTIAQPFQKIALFYEKLNGKAVQCRLCPRECYISLGKKGFCGVRQNSNGELYSESFAKLVAIHIDPIEKKPLFHFLPGTTAFSIAAAGCNLKCAFCQNWEISQVPSETLRYIFLEPKDLIKKVQESKSPVIAYTYTEPTIFYEYMLETAQLAKKAGIRNVMHSSGYINEEPLRRLAPYLDAANIDIKGFTEDFYHKMTQGSLAPVLKSLKILKEFGVHLEITALLIPGYNDTQNSIAQMCDWIKENLGIDTPLHFSRFFPMYKLLSLSPTPAETLQASRQIALSRGLKYVYIGNLPGNQGEHTYCPRCHKIVIKRNGYFIVEKNLKNQACAFCAEKIEGVWNENP
ncbi:MAG: AmmeMemoRadiSam system radical SAM enzyme [Candidatus Omnitrophota bacterium]|jgi:pyruvate formate lyase activating enzyme